MHQKKSILPNGIADDQSASLPSARRGASHAASHCASHRRGGAGRRWGLHLVRRNGIFHFRRRWPEALRRLGAPEFLSVSLRTNFLSIATERACSLRTALSIGERELIAELEDKQLDPGQVSAFLREMVRKAVVGMVESQEAPATAPELPEVRLATLESHQAEIRNALRQRNWAPARAIAAPSALEFGLTDGDLGQPSLARRLLTAQLRVLELEAQVEKTFDDPLHLGKDLLENHGLVGVVAEVSAGRIHLANPVG